MPRETAVAAAAPRESGRLMFRPGDDDNESSNEDEEEDHDHDDDDDGDNTDDLAQPARKVKSDAPTGGGSIAAAALATVARVARGKARSFI